MGDMVERVARAIATGEGRGMIFNEQDDWFKTDAYKNERQQCFSAARAAIAATLYKRSFIEMDTGKRMYAFSKDEIDAALQEDKP